MKGLLLKDFYMAKKYCRSYLFVLVAFLAAGFFGGNTFMMIFPALLIGMLPVTLISYDEREKWCLYCETMPYSKCQLVSSKYLLGLISVLAVTVLDVAVLTVGMMARNAENVGEILLLNMSPAMIAVGLLGSGLVLPFIFWLGVEKGRIAYYLLLILISSATAFLTQVGAEKDLPTSALDGASAWLIAALAVVVYAISWAVSTVLYKKREL